MSWIFLGILACIPVIGWWAAATAAKESRQRAELADAQAKSYAAANQGLRERLLAAEKQVEWYRSRETHPSFRRVK